MSHCDATPRSLVAWRSRHGGAECAHTAQLRSVFISDIHLGFKGCSAELLLDFLHHVEMDYLFLVGDIVDVWSMKRACSGRRRIITWCGRYWARPSGAPKSFSSRAITMRCFRDFDGAVFGNLEIHREYIHEGADGRRMLVLHGDEFDSVVKCSPVARQIGQQHLRRAAGANPYINWCARLFELPHWSLSAYLKNKAKSAVQYIGSFEEAVAQAARKRGVDTVVCGHIHRAELRDIKASFTATTGTGSKAAPRWSRI